MPNPLIELRLAEAALEGALHQLNTAHERLRVARVAAEAVPRGWSGLLHRWRSPENADARAVDVRPREERLRQYMQIDREVGLEIGPLDKAIVPQIPGREIYYCDYADRAALQLRSKDDPNVAIDRIPEIDFVTPAITAESFGGQRFDYIVASHVIEHVPDVIGWLRTLIGSLRPGGRLVLAVPDRRYTFDYLRPLSNIGEMLEAWWQRRGHPSPSQVYDANRMAMRVDTQLAWTPQFDPAMLEPHFSREQVLQWACDVQRDGSYHDCHCWVFEYPQFLACLDELFALDALQAELVAEAAPVYGANEFHIVLGPPAEA